ncbi:MAG: HDOD domain-containing protein [Desulfobacteraceae bacterium]|jgi:putative nucleotidyltransferase with HDIG domain
MLTSDEKINKINKLIQLVDNSDISSIKNIVIGLIKIINNPNSTARDLTELIQIDPPLTAKVLKLANSAYYSPREKISEITRAVIWVGYDAIKELAINQKVCEIFINGQSDGEYSRERLWKHSLAVALLAKLIYRREFGERGENIYAAGLLHEIGIIANDQFFPNKFQQLLHQSKINNQNLTDIEYENSGYDHAEAGRAIMEHWQIPGEICSAIGNHHMPEDTSGQYIKSTYTLYIADYFCQRKEIGFCDAPFEPENTFKRCMKQLGLEYHALEILFENVEIDMKKMEEQGFF